MADIDFPTPPNFPSPLWNSLSDQPIPNFLEGENDAGLETRRIVISELFDTFSVSYMCTEEQRQYMKYTFLRETTANGIRAFNWTDPESDITYEVVFDREQLPSFTRSGGLDKPWICNIRFKQIVALS